MATELDELIDFLSSPSLQVKKAAVDIVRGLTGSEETLLSLSTRADSAVPALSRLLPQPPDFSVPAAEALVNLSQDPSLAEKIVYHGAIHTAMEVLYKGGNSGEMARLLIMLLLNLTQLDSGISVLLQIGDEKLEGLYISKLVRSFCRSSNTETAGEFSQVSGTVRNCCFEADYWIEELLSISEFLWPVLLLPVAGKKAYNQDDTSKMPLELGNVLSHEREPIDDPDLRIQALDSIYLITLQEAGRRALWSVNGPRILQVGYEDEEDTNVMEAYERIGSLLLDNK